MTTLQRVQQRFWSVLADRRDPSDSAQDLDPRIRIYWWMYSARLRDILHGDYPRVAAVLGPVAFAEVADAYLRAHPSEQASLRWFGERFAGFLEQDATLRQDLADLARLDWARVEAFDAPDEAALSLADAGWHERVLRTVTSAQVLETTYAVEALWLAADRRELPSEEPRLGAERLLVWRVDFVVRHRAVSPAERAAIALLERPVGATFAEICAVLATSVDLNDAVTTAARWMAQWAADGLVTYALPG